MVSDGDLAVGAVLVFAKLRGMADLDQIVAGTRLAKDDVGPIVAELTVAGQLAELPNGRYRLTPPGAAAAAAWRSSETAEIDRDALSAVYEQFIPANSELKKIMQSWQLRDGDRPNDHSDLGYDGEVITRLLDLHMDARGWLASLPTIVPRWSCYASRLSDAANRIQDGDTSYFARPLMDSYHTVWFELHDELIQGLGKTREAEAAAGRAE